MPIFLQAVPNIGRIMISDEFWIKQQRPTKSMKILRRTQRRTASRRQSLN